MPMHIKQIIAFAVSLLSGYLAGQGVGGGSLLMLWLTQAAGREFEMARTMNLLLFLPTAFISSVIHIKKQTLPVKKAVPVVLSGAAGAILASILSAHIKTHFLKKAFGLLIMVTGIREVHLRERKPR